MRNMKMKSLFLAAILSIMGVSLQAQVASTVSDYKIKFYIKNAGFTVDGTLKDLSSDIYVDLQNPGGSRIKASVPVKTLDTGIGSRDEHLMKKDYFDVATYPNLSIEATSLTSKGNGTWQGKFNVTIKGKTKAYTIPVTYEEKAGKLRINSKFKINRRDFGVGGSSLILSDTVRIELSADLSMTEAAQGK